MRGRRESPKDVAVKMINLQSDMPYFEVRCVSEIVGKFMQFVD